MIGIGRRDFMRIAGSVPALLAAGCGRRSFNADPRLPSVLFITADDLGWLDVGCYGNHNLATPNIDRLAREGVLFRNAFGVTSSCSPARATFITGQYPHTHGVTGLTNRYPLRSLSPFHPTLPELLRNAGFDTALEGKWHVSPFLPVSLYGYNHRLSGVLPSGMMIRDSQRSVDFIRRSRAHRFYFELNYMNTHRDDDGDFELDERFPVDPRAIEIPAYLHLPDWPEVRLELARFYSQLQAMDAMIGDVLAALDESGVSDNTLVIFVSDNGAPLPGCKMTLYDRGIGTPLLMRWPRRIPAGREVTELVSTLDLMPTVLDAAGIDIPAGVEGRSLLPQATGELNGDVGREAIYAEMTDHVNHIPMRAVRTREWKLIRNDSDDPIGLDQLADEEWAHRLCDLPDQPWKRRRIPLELYDLAADPTEQNNLAASPRHADVRDRLLLLLEADSPAEGS